MKRYEVLREIYNSCSGMYSIDYSFTRDIETDNIENTLKSWISGVFPDYEKKIVDDETVIYVLKLPMLEIYTFTEF